MTTTDRTAALAAAEAHLAEAQGDVQRLRAALAGESTAAPTADKVRAEILAAVRRRHGQTRSDQLAAQAAAAGLPAPSPGTPTAGSSRADGVAAARARRRR